MAKILKNVTIAGLLHPSPDAEAMNAAGWPEHVLISTPLPAGHSSLFHSTTMDDRRGTR